MKTTPPFDRSFWQLPLALCAFDVAFSVEGPRPLCLHACVDRRRRRQSILSHRLVTKDKVIKMYNRSLMEPRLHLPPLFFLLSLLCTSRISRLTCCTWSPLIETLPLKVQSPVFDGRVIHSDWLRLGPCLRVVAMHDVRPGHNLFDGREKELANDCYSRIMRCSSTRTCTQTSRFFNERMS